MGGRAKLTHRQIAALRWIRDTPHHRARWLVNGEDAFGPPETWDELEISGYTSSLRLPVADKDALDGLVGPVGLPNRFYELTDAGREALRDGG